MWICHTKLQLIHRHEEYANTEHDVWPDTQQWTPVNNEAYANADR